MNCFACLANDEDILRIFDCKLHVDLTGIFFGSCAKTTA